MASGRLAHDQGDCNGDFTCYWCWEEDQEDRARSWEGRVDQEPAEGDDA